MRPFASFASGPPSGPAPSSQSRQRRLTRIQGRLALSASNGERQPACPVCDREPDRGSMAVRIRLRSLRLGSGRSPSREERLLELGSLSPDWVRMIPASSTALFQNQPPRTCKVPSSVAALVENRISASVSDRSASPESAPSNSRCLISGIEPRTRSRTPTTCSRLCRCCRFRDGPK